MQPETSKKIKPVTYQIKVCPQQVVLAEAFFKEKSPCPSLPCTCPGSRRLQPATEIICNQLQENCERMCTLSGDIPNWIMMNPSFNHFNPFRPLPRFPPRPSCSSPQQGGGLHAGELQSGASHVGLCPGNATGESPGCPGQNKVGTYWINLAYYHTYYII